MIALIILVVAAVLIAFTAHAAFNRGYALGERHGRETAEAIMLHPETAARHFLGQLDRTRATSLGLNGTRAQALETMR